MKVPRPGKGFKRFKHGWGKNIKMIRFKGQWTLTKKDKNKECVYVSDSISYIHPVNK